MNREEIIEWERFLEEELIGSFGLREIYNVFYGLWYVEFRNFCLRVIFSRNTYILLRFLELDCNLFKIRDNL